MAHKEINLKFPIGKLYQIEFDTFDEFGALINNKTVRFLSRETVFLMLGIEYDGKYCKITALFHSGQVGTISCLYSNEIKML